MLLSLEFTKVGARFYIDSGSEVMYDIFTGFLSEGEEYAVKEPLPAEVHKNEMHIQLLGGFAVIVDGAPIPDTHWRSRRARNLIKLLALAPNYRLQRDQVLDALWPDSDLAAATNNLHQTLYNARQILDPLTPGCLSMGEGLLSLSGGEDRSLSVDVTQFEAAAARAKRDQNPGAYRAALALYTSELLPEDRYEDWTVRRRETLQQTYLQLLLNLARLQETQGDYPAGIETLQHLLAADPCYETAHAGLMRLFSLSGQRQQALRQYQTLYKVLQVELDAEPSLSTNQLYKSIQSGQFRESTSVLMPNIPARYDNLPAMISPIVGRERELKELSTRLADPACRLLTVIGPGGCGKTRLSIEAAHRQIERFKHGVYWVSLVGIRTPQAIPQAFAQALGFLFGPNEEPWKQILDYLRHKQILLVLDNFEHILEAAEMVVELLRQAPQIKILVTSRTRLNLLEESLFPLGGMEVPEDSTHEGRIADITSYDAIQLFLEEARRVHPKFTPGDEDGVHIAAVCRLLAGMPLAILLSASWARLLKPAEIYTQILQSRLDFLETDWRDVPERHRSMRLVFDYSWNLLTTEQQETLAGLSVFQGSFTIQAAQSVTDIGLRGLRDLVDRSLVQLISGERFELHLLMQEYAAGKLEAMPEKSGEFNHRHCRYFMEMLARWATALQGSGQVDAQREITLEGENIPAAWNWAVSHVQYDCMAQAVDGLGGMYERRCLYRQGESIFQNTSAQIRLAISVLKKKRGTEISRLSLLLARILGWQAFFNRMLGNNHAADLAIENGMMLLEGDPYQEQDLCVAKAFLLQQRGLLVINSDRAQSLTDFQESLVMYRLVEDTWREAQVLTSLARVASAFGHYAEAIAYLEDSLSRQRSLGDYLGMADTLGTMSVMLSAFGDFDKMAQLVQEQATIIQKLGNPAQLADNLLIESVNLGYLGRFAETARLMKEAMAIQENLGSQAAVMSSGHLLGWIEVNQGLYDQGYDRFQVSLTMARQLGDLHLVSLGLLGLGEVFLVRGDYDQARYALQDSVALYRQVRQDDELSIALAALADVEIRLSLSDQATFHLEEALQIAARTDSWQACLYVIGKTAHLMALTREVELGVEMYALASSYPYLGNSVFWEDCVGKRLAELSNEIPEKNRIGAIGRGKQRNLHKTVMELCTWIQEKKGVIGSHADTSPG